MPPKKQPNAKDQKAKQKLVEDKTFGMKNKNKSKSVQKFIKGVAGSAGVPQKQKFKDKKSEEVEKEKAAIEAALFKPVAAPAQTKVPVGVDPKSVVCEFFKKGLCQKGDKCKFSHNLEQGRKAEKIDIYTDPRAAKDQEGEKPEGKDGDDMENWDQTKLETVIETKRGSENKNLKTKIVCKYFLEAIENKKYGWFWECPNGGEKCPYMHALPPGYQLKITKKKEEEEDYEPTPIEEIIEEARSKLTTRTPITHEIFLKWKEDKKKQKENLDKEKKEKRDQEVKSGKAMRSGREMFEFNPNLFTDDDGVLDTQELEPEQEDDEPVIEIDVTGTSIRTTIINKNDNDNENGEQVEESLFNEEDIPEDEDDNDEQ